MEKKSKDKAKTKNKKILSSRIKIKNYIWKKKGKEKINYGNNRIRN